MNPSSVIQSPDNLSLLMQLWPRTNLSRSPDLKDL